MCIENAYWQSIDSTAKNVNEVSFTFEGWPQNNAVISRCALSDNYTYHAHQVDAQKQGGLCEA
jgi:hypothetical protein